MFTIRSPFCGYNMTQCVEFSGEDLLCYQIKLTELVHENVHMITDIPTKRYNSDKYFSEFLPTRWRQKSAGVDIKENYVNCHPMY